MRSFDVTDESILNASPDQVYSALLSEYTGKTRWAAPDVTGKPRAASPEGRVGELVDLHVNRPGRPKFTARLAELSRPNLLRVEYVEGDFLGEGVWTIERVDAGARACFRWRVRPGPWHLRMLSNFLDFGKNHSEVMRCLFDRLQRYFDDQREPRESAAR